MNLTFFYTDACSLHVQLIDIKSKELWSNKFKDTTSRFEELERENSNLIFKDKCIAIKQPLKIETTLNVWSTLPDTYDAEKKQFLIFPQPLALHIYIYMRANILSYELNKK